MHLLFAWFFIVGSVLSAVGKVFLIDKDREPVTRQEGAAAVLFNGLMAFGIWYFFV